MHPVLQRHLDLQAQFVQSFACRLFVNEGSEDDFLFRTAFPRVYPHGKILSVIAYAFGELSLAFCMHGDYLLSASVEHNGGNNGLLCGRSDVPRETSAHGQPFDAAVRPVGQRPLVRFRFLDGDAFSAFQFTRSKRNAESKRHPGPRFPDAVHLCQREAMTAGAL